MLRIINFHLSTKQYHFFAGFTGIDDPYEVPFNCEVIPNPEGNDNISLKD